MQRFATPGDLYPSPDLLFTSSVCIDSTTVREIPRARRSCPRLILMWGWPCWGRILRSWSYRLVPVDLETRGRASLHSNTNKKLGYRRDTARQLHTSFSTRSLIVHHGLKITKKGLSHWKRYRPYNSVGPPRGKFGLLSEACLTSSVLLSICIYRNLGVTLCQAKRDRRHANELSKDTQHQW